MKRWITNHTLPLLLSLALLISNGIPVYALVDTSWTSAISEATPSNAKKQGKFSDIVRFQSITLHYASTDDQLDGDVVQDNALIKKDQKLVLRYTYEINEEQCQNIKSDTSYYLEVSPHLVLPDLNGSPLTIETEDGEEQFGRLYAERSSGRAWVEFDAKTDSSDTVLSDYEGLEDAFFYLNCTRAGDVPPDEMPVEGKNNLYAMKFEDNSQINFGYAENEPIHAKAKIQKGGEVNDKTITWEIDYTPHQNPDGKDAISLDTPIELRDKIDTSLHQYVENSIKIDGSFVSVYASRDDIPADADTYALIEPLVNEGETVLVFGGTRFCAGEATQANPAQELKITYQTLIKDELLLPGSGGKKISNTADVFAEKDGLWNALGISSQSTVIIPQPVWITKTGKTTRHTDGTGSTTDWTITMNPNGFSFTEDNELTLHDQLPDGSSLVEDSIQIEGKTAAEMKRYNVGNNTFTISPIEVSDKPVNITYQTVVPEEMYNSGTSLGNNVAFFTFNYKDREYTTPKITVPVGSGDGSGTSGTSVLMKTNDGFHPKDRTISWTVEINPHKANFLGGDFSDNLSIIGPRCTIAGHRSGLELAGDIQDILVLFDNQNPEENEKDLVSFVYDNDSQHLSIKVGEIGRRKITLRYTTKVCDPCLFSNNTSEVMLKNTISTTNMKIGNMDEERSASADSTVKVSSEVLAKKPPVYDYSARTMKWTVEVDAAGLPMTDVVLSDNLPLGLTYKEGTLAAEPDPEKLEASLSGQELTMNLGRVDEKTMVTFETEVDPEILGFGGDQTVVVENTIRMKGWADGVEFAEVSHQVEQRFSNHGLLKTSGVDNQQELIRYEVLINPFGLALPENPALVDTLDKRLQLDTDTLYFYPADLSGTSVDKDQKPSYQKTGTGQPLSIADYDPSSNAFTVQLPINEGSREAYVLTYTADIIKRQTGGYSNSVYFDGGSMLLGGNKNNNAFVGGGGGGGGGGVAARKADIQIVKKDSENQMPLAGVTFTLYQWNHEEQVRGLPFAQGITDAEGKLSFKVKPRASYELVETKSIPGYSSVLAWEQLPEGVAVTDNGLFIQAGEAKSEQKLNLFNEPETSDDPGNTDPPNPPDDPGNTDQPNPPDDSGNTDPPSPPDGSGNIDPPSSPDDSGNTDLPSLPDDSGNTDPPSPPDDSGNTDLPSPPDDSGNTDPPGSLDKPEISHPSEISGVYSAASGYSGTSATGISGTISNASDALNSDAIPENAESSMGDSSVLKPLENDIFPENAEVSESPDSPEVYNIPDKQKHISSSAISAFPKTGDNTAWLIVIVFFSGILMMIKIFYKFLQSVKHKKEKIT